MPAKLILSLDGVVLNEYRLDKERTTIGRKPQNDIVIDNLAISGEHAVVITILNDSFLEDLDSTNGLAVNGNMTKKHFLQHNDVIEIGKYKLKYINEQFVPAEKEDLEKTMVFTRPAPIVSSAVTTPAAEHAADKTGKFEYDAAAQARPAPAPQASPPPLAAIQVLNGPNAGKEVELVKNLSTLGKPGVQVAVLARRPHGYFITHVEGARHPLVNGESIGERPHQLNDHDIIELGNVKMEFYLKG